MKRIKQKLLFILIFTLFICNIVQPARAAGPDDWNYQGYDIRNTRYNPNSNGPETNNLAWSTDLGDCDEVSAVPIISGKLLFLISDSLKLHAINLEHPEITEWVYDLSPGGDPYSYGDIAPATPSVENGVIYVAAQEKNIVAINIATGHPERTYETDSSVKGFLVYEGKIYAGMKNGTLQTIDLATGKILWSFIGGNGYFSYPAIDKNSNVIYVRNEEKLYALDLTTGLEKWNYQTSSESSPYTILSYPVVGDDGTVYIGRDALYAIQNGTLKWKFKSEGWFTASVALRDGVIYVGDTKGMFYALSADDGGIKWTYKAQQGIDEAAVVANNGVYMGCPSDNLYAFNFDGTLKWVYSIRYYIYRSPIVSGGKLYVPNFDLLVFGPAE